MKIRIPVPHFSVRCVRCNATAPVFEYVVDKPSIEIDLDCSCPNEKPVCELVFAYPAGHHLSAVPLVSSGSGLPSRSPDRPT